MTCIDHAQENDILMIACAKKKDQYSYDGWNSGWIKHDLYNSDL